MEEKNEINSQDERQDNQNEQLQQIIQSSENIQSPQVVEQAAVPIEYAGFWARFAAQLVDSLVLFIPSIIINIIGGKYLGVFLGYALMWVYAIYMLKTRQATLGKMAVGLKVTTLDDKKLTLEKLALREILGKILNIFTLYVGFLMVGFTKRKQGLHDIIAGTVVIYDPARKRRPWLVAFGVIFALAFPIIGVLAGIVLVSTSSARNKAEQSAAKQYGKSVLTEVAICQNEGGNINSYESAKAICDLPSHDVDWPESIKKYKFVAPAAKNEDLYRYTFKLAAPGMPDVNCSVATMRCE